MRRFFWLICFLPWWAATSAAETKPCPFCEIAAGRLPAVIVCREGGVLAFMDRAPRNPGHVLIAPVAHADNILDVPPETLREMVTLAQRIARAIRQTDLNSEGIAVQMNTGRPAGQTVPHAHLHIIPRFAGDDRVHSESDVVPPAELELVAAKIRAKLEPPADLNP